MADPKIKREHSPERPLSNAPAESRGAIVTPFAAAPAHHKRDDDSACSRPMYTRRPLPLRVYQDTEPKSSPARIKTEPIDQDHVVAAAPAPAKDREVQPRHNKFVGPRHVSGNRGAQVLPAVSWLSSRPASAPKQTPALTTTFNILAKHFRPHSARSLMNQHLLPTYQKQIQRVTSMDGFGFEGNGGFGGGQEIDYDGLGAYTGIPGTPCIRPASYTDCKLTVMRSSTDGDSAFGGISEASDGRSVP